MTTFIKRMNTADNLGKLFRQGCIPAVILKDTLESMGYSHVRIHNKSVQCRFEDDFYTLRESDCA